MKDFLFKEQKYFKWLQEWDMFMVKYIQNISQKRTDTKSEMQNISHTITD